MLVFPSAIDPNEIFQAALSLFVTLCLFCGVFSPYMQVTTIENPYPIKEEEENAMHNTVVIFSSNDSFTLKQVCFLFIYVYT